jgi:prepilin-type N-terminal cleavage/methylation domain-containing protein
MMSRRSRFPGFTLIELTLVMAIIGLLVAIAVPNFMKYQSRTRQSEAKVLIGAIAARQMQYKLETGSFISCPPNPVMADSPWDKSLAEWNRIGFAASGPLWYQYSVEADETGFIIYAKANLDRDPTVDTWTMSSRDLRLANDVNDTAD